MDEEEIINQHLDSSYSSDEEEKEFEHRTEELEAQLSQNNYLYDAHVELVGLYRKMADLNSMRAAYERFHKYFPLTPDLWLDWIHDEMQIANSTEEKKHVLHLFNKAVEDYQSVKLWQEYAQFVIGLCNIDETRSIIERGLNAVGLHVSQGSLLWDVLREFELAHLSLAKPDTDEFSIQVLKVVEIFRRQLSVPLLDMENTFKEWEDFIHQLPDDHGIDIKAVEWGYKKAYQLLESYKSYEESLLATEDDNEMYKIYKDYINFVKDPSLIITLYERAVSQLCLNVSLWEDYCYYTIKLGDIALRVTEKALRNCPWYSSLWIARIRILEVLKKSENDIMTCFEEAIKSVSTTQLLEVWITYIEYTKRTAVDLKHLDKLCSQAIEQLGVEGDPNSKIPRFQANLHARNNDMNTARKLWSGIMHNISNKRSAYTWIEYLTLEKQFGEPQQVRQLYQRAISNCKDWEQYFTDEWLMYEREIGTIEDVLKCFEKCKKIAKFDANASTHLKSNTKKRNLDEENDSCNHPKKQKITKIHKTKENELKWRNREPMEIDATTVKIKSAPVDIDPDKSVFLSNFALKMTEEDFKTVFPNAKRITIPTDRKGKPRCFAYVEFETSDEATEALKKDREPINGRPLFVSKCQKERGQRQPVFKYSDKFEANKLFVKGLPKHYNKEAIEEIFKPYKAVDVRLVTKFNGEFKGLAYIDFANEEDAALALKNTDQMILDEYKITVAISAPPSKQREIVPTQNKQNVRHSKTQLEIPFVPRSLQLKQSNIQDAHNISKTNDDFRKMLLNK